MNKGNNQTCMALRALWKGARWFGLSMALILGMLHFVVDVEVEFQQTAASLGALVELCLGWKFGWRRGGLRRPIQRPQLPLARPIGK